MGYNGFVSSAAVAYVVIAAVLSVVLALFATNIVSAFRITGDLTDTAVILIRWYGPVACILTFVSSVYGAVLISSNRFDVYNYIQVGVAVARGLLVFWVLLFTGYGLVGWAVAMAASQLVGLVCLRVSAMRICPFIQFQLKNVGKKPVVSLFKVGGSVFILQLTNLLGIRTDPIVISSILGASAVALYAPITSLTGAVRPIVDTLTRQLHPLATGYHVKEQASHLQGLLVRGTKYTLLMGVLACVTLGVFAKPICEVWLGAEIGDDYLIVARVLMLWSIVDYLYYAGGAQYPTLLGMNRLKFLVRLQAPFSVVNVTASILIVKYTNLGVVGVVIPTIVINSVLGPIISVYTARQVGLGGRKYFYDSYLWPVVITFVLGLAAWLLERWAAPASLVGIASCVALVAVTWAALCWFVGFNKDDRASFRSLAGRLPWRTEQ